MIIKVGNKTHDGNDQPMAIQLSEHDLKIIVENHDNPLWKGKIMSCPVGYFKTDKEKERYIDDMPCDNNKYSDGYLNLIEK